MKKWIAPLLVPLCVSMITAPTYAKSIETRDDSVKIEAKHTSPIPKKSQLAKSSFLKNVSNHTNLYIIQFSGPIEEEWKERMEQLDVSLGMYLPDFAYIAKIPNSSTRKTLDKLSYVKDIHEWKPLYKIDPDLVSSMEKNEQVEVYIEGFDPTTNQVNKAIKKAGATLSISSETQEPHKVHAMISRDNMHQLLNSDDVVVVTPVQKRKYINNVASQIIGSSELQRTKYDGKNQVVSVLDSGVDTGDLASIHKDLRNQISKLYYLGLDAMDYVGHGTHVLGSIVGNGSLSDGEVKGMAPGAKAIVYSLDDGNGDILSVDFNYVWSDAYKKGARINSLSLGGEELAEYNYDSQSVDTFLWQHPDAISVIAAGNEADKYDDEFYTISPPGTAKNSLTVGASESERSSFGSSADNADDVAYFSSRGPTADGRIKPDVVAPGTAILSTRSILSDGYQDIVGAYGYMSGTSMATPITAGGVAQVRQYLQEKGVKNPSGALLKAMIISGAEDIQDSLYRMGYGRVNLPQTIESSYVDQTNGLRTKDTVTYQIEVNDVNKPFNATLVWTDYPASLFASRALVNDLNLEVTTPSGDTLNGNDFNGDLNDEVDNLNNVEQVYVERPEKGTYTVKISGYNVPKGPQPFAFVSSSKIVQKLISKENLSAKATLSKDSISLTLSGSVSPSVNAVKIDTLGIKNAAVKVSKASISFKKSVKATTSPIEEIKVTASDKKGNSDTITIPVEVNLLDDTSITCEETSENDTYTYHVTGDITGAVSKLYYLANGKLTPISFANNAFSLEFSVKNAWDKVTLIAVDKKGYYEVITTSPNK